jgi:hypothetical protein
LYAGNSFQTENNPSPLSCFPNQLTIQATAQRTVALALKSNRLSNAGKLGSIALFHLRQVWGEFDKQLRRIICIAYNVL